ncbi:sulfotransferase family protein [Jannaschia aquimarina]|uniref:Sulfotransferase domain protein n=1 Tax=Jannaschia aquimarina TaxID=935700 RepID=A0A0D1EC14_9RHOB|nr:sulfotransferase [Jannaschia aquimarina]KIT15264.1 hypothetical protein jaqu_30110 [Jannaschia aquimarina]SNS87712.1 Sulfotransferase family protein [Jannaschia aquimarina]
MTGDKKFLFVAGNARSGTTAMVRLLNCHRRVIIHTERFRPLFVKGELKRAHLEKESFLSKEHRLPQMIPTDRAGLLARYDDAIYVGDKFPLMFKDFDLMDREFPGVEILYMVRNPVSVANSYQARFEEREQWKRNAFFSVKEWSRSVRLGLERIEGGKRLSVVPYEDAFASAENVRTIFRHLGLDPEDADWDRISDLLAEAAELEQTFEVRNDKLRQHIFLNAAIGPYRRLVTEHSIFNAVAADAPVLADAQPSGVQ